MLAVFALVEGRVRVAVAALFEVSVKAVDNWWAKWQPEGCPSQRLLRPATLIDNSIPVTPLFTWLKRVHRWSCGISIFPHLSGPACL